MATREEIRRKLWPNDTVVEFDHAINTAMKKLRQALGDSAQSPTYAKPNGHEGRVICTHTTDGGKTWKLASFVTAEPEGNDYSIMPSSVRLSPASILTAVRYRHRNELYRSDDDGATWSGDADTRVPPEQARKMTARLQAATSSGRPILLLYDAKAGHAGGQPFKKIVEDSTDELSFVAW